MLPRCCQGTLEKEGGPDAAACDPSTHVWGHWSSSLTLVLSCAACHPRPTQIDFSQPLLLPRHGIVLVGSLDGTVYAVFELNGTLADTRPALRQVAESTLPAAEAAVRDLRATSRALRNVTEKLDEQGAGAVLQGNNLPDYKP